MRGFSQSIKRKRCHSVPLLLFLGGGGACGASSENPNVADFVELKDCARDVTASTTKGNYYSHGQVSKDHFDLQFSMTT